RKRGQRSRRLPTTNQTPTDPPSGRPAPCETTNESPRDGPHNELPAVARERRRSNCSPSRGSSPAPLRTPAVHLGDLLRIWVRPGARFTPSPPDFQGPARAHRTPPNRDAFQGLGPSLGANPFQGALPFTKKRELSPGLPPASPGSVALPHWTPRGAHLRHSGFGDLNPTPFRSAGGDGGHRPSLPNGVRPSLRTD
uniref:Uncharacterized protein n=1 Tax=Oncorhynchus mykiss TaxID=8022 RepID=A0A8K9WQY5_ONCMY